MIFISLPFVNQKYMTHKNIVFVLMIIMAICLVVGSCRNTSGPPVQETTPPMEEPIVKTDSTWLFNGVSLDGWEITNFGPQGPVSVSGGQIILGMGDGCTGITWKRYFPDMNYKVSLEAKRVAGNDFFCGMTFPVGKESCSLIIGGWAGTTVGLSSINKKDASENQTTSYKLFERNRWYHIGLIVKKDTIQAFIDDEMVVNYVRSENDVLSVRPEVELSKPFGIASWYTTAALKNIRVTEIND
jgi:hypothetical protein